MKDKLQLLLLGILVGAVLGFSAKYMIGQRYNVTSNGPEGIMTIKTDRWTGRSWMMRYYEDKGVRTYFWEEMSSRQ